jgi:hypothetical protein
VTFVLEANTLLAKELSWWRDMSASPPLPPPPPPTLNPEPTPFVSSIASSSWRSDELPDWLRSSAHSGPTPPPASDKGRGEAGGPSQGEGQAPRHQVAVGFHGCRQTAIRSLRDHRSASGPRSASRRWGLEGRCTQKRKEKERKVASGRRSLQLFQQQPSGQALPKSFVLLPLSGTGASGA